MTDLKINAIIEGNELIVRQGEAAPIENKVNISLNTNITGPADWYESKLGLYDWKRSHVKVDLEKKSIILIVGEHENHGTVKIEGSLQSNKDLQEFKINNLKDVWTGKQLSSFLKMRRVFFSDPEENMMVVKNLEDLKLKVTQEIEQKNDFKGNKKAHFEQNLESDIKIWFVLRIPIFKGAIPSLFRVDINFDVTDGNAYFWLESTELKSLEYIAAEEIITREIERFGPNSKRKMLR